MKKSILFVLAIWGAIVSGHSQTIHCYLPFKAECPGQVTIPVEVENFDAVASASIGFAYDTLALEFLSSQNLHPSLSTGIHVINAIHGNLIFSWFSLTPATIGTGTFIELLFESRAARSSVLKWDTLQAGNCIFTDISGNEYPGIFHDGFVTNMLQVPGLINPANQSSGIPTNPDFSWTVSECDGRFEFQLSTTNDFSQLQFQQHNLLIPAVSVNGLEFNKTYYWRVRSGTVNDTTPWSPISQFQTKGPDGIEDPLQPVPIKVLSLYQSNPNTLNIELESLGLISLESSITDITGRSFFTCRWGNLSGGSQILHIPLSDQTPGLYWIHFRISHEGKMHQIVRKITLLR